MTNRRELLLATGAAGLAMTALAGDDKHTQTTNAALDSEKFRNAVLTGDLATVTSMLDRDPGLRYARDKDGVSVYILACLHGQSKVAEELVHRGLALDAFEAAVSGDAKRLNELAKDDPSIAHHRLPDGRTPLHLATEAGKPDLVFPLSTLGADLSAGPESPLLAAVNYPDRTKAEEMSRSLLMNASDPNARRKDGKAALQLASARGYDEVVEMLVHRGADASGLPNPPKVERVYFARRLTQDLRGNPVTREDTYGIPQQLVNEFSRVAHFDFERVKHLQKLCPMLIMTRASWDELGIEAAAHMGLTSMAKYLADLGAPVSTCTATLLGEKNLVKRLVKEDAGCLRERGAHDIALLAYTAYAEQQVDLAEFLLDAGADVQARALGQTILHIAAAKGHVELAKTLLDHGADVNATAIMRATPVTPLAVAMQAKKATMVEFLKDHGGRA
ncbi:MAG TPA: ankyrin repeat domain-containing protein [Bryobacteraceae bacterium]|nr:ankyrin repeat domain-containing protein [Bryobacteraceae bacterium]